MRFELTPYKRVLDDEEIIKDIQLVAKKHKEGYLSLSKYIRYGKYSQCAIQGHFGTWKEALIRAGLRSTRNQDELNRISNQQYFDDLQRVAKELNSATISYKDYCDRGKYATTHIIKRFKHWDTALTMAGLSPTGKAKMKVTEKECLEDIERMWVTLGRQPTTTDVQKLALAKYSLDTYKRRFGGWRKALEAFIAYVNGVTDAEHDSASEEVNIYADNCDNNEENALKTSSSDARKTPRNINLRLRFKVLSRDNFKCQACGASPTTIPSTILHVDHIIPWSQGGETVIDNLQTLCSDCNLGKGDLLL